MTQIFSPDNCNVGQMVIIKGQKQTAILRVVLIQHNGVPSRAIDMQEAEILEEITK